MNRAEAIRLLERGQEGVVEWNSLRKSGEPMPNLDSIRLNSERLGELDLSGVDLRNLNLSNGQFAGTNLSEANLLGAELNNTYFHFANLNGANLSSANLYYAELSHATLIGADLNWCDFSWSDLTEADLSEANLSGAIFRQTILWGTILRRSVLHTTLFAQVDLSGVDGLDEIRHLGPSTIGADTLFLSGALSSAFLSNCGLPSVLIESMPLLIGASQPIDFCSCFISYSTIDEKFTTRLYTDLKCAGIRCYKWDENARTGNPLWGEIDKAIQGHDKVLLIASESALKSPQVTREIERALQEEDRRSRLNHEGKYVGDTNVLFPVRLDDYITKGWQHYRKADVMAKMIADARSWHEGKKQYDEIRDRLIEHLKTTALNDVEPH